MSQCGNPSVIAAHIHEKFDHIQIAPLARKIVKLDKRQLDLLVSRGEEGGALLLDKHTLDEIYVAKHGAVEFVLARCLVIRDSRLQKMSRAVKLVTIAHGKALPRLYHGIVDIEISVLPLIGNQIVDNAVSQRLKLRNGRQPRKVCHRLDPLCHVRVPEKVGALVHALLPLATESLHTSRLIKAIVHAFGGHAAHQLLPLRPKATRDANIFKTDILHRDTLQKGMYFCTILSQSF